MENEFENIVKNNIRTLKEDYEFGKFNETKLLPIINKHFNDDINFIDYKYSYYDYQGSKYKYELKSRTNKYLDY